MDILVVGCGNMGSSHARAYKRLDGFNIVGLVSRGPESRERLSDELGGVPTFGDFEEALRKTQPDAASINTYQGTHAEYAITALQQGAHVFVEKPLAETVEEAEEVVQAARKAGKKLLVGYLLRHHPGWKQFVEHSRQLGKPLVMRMNLNQQSTGPEWQVHKNLMQSMSPIVDCGVHYVDMMCLMTGATPTHVHAIGARLSEEIPEDMYNYGQLQVNFDDGSVGWYESGWGPMMSESAYFIKDVVGPKGSVSIQKNTFDAPAGMSADIEEHSKVDKLLRHYAPGSEGSSAGSNGSETGVAGDGDAVTRNAGKDGDGQAERKTVAEQTAGRDELIETPEEATHDELCFYEQQYFLKAIQEDVDLEDHMQAAVQTLQIVLACDESVKTGQKVAL